MKTNKALLVLVALLSTQFVEAHKDKKQCLPDGVLKKSFAKGGPTPGIAINSISNLTDYATDAVILKKKGCFHRLLVKATAHIKQDQPQDCNAINNTARNRLGSVVLAYNPNGSLDTSFGNGAGYVEDTTFGDWSDYLLNIDTTKNDTFIVGGFIDTRPEGAQSVGNGTVITNFNSNAVCTPPFFNEPVYVQFAAPDDALFFDLGYSKHQFAAAMYEADGTSDSSFGSSGKAVYHSDIENTVGNWGNITGISSQAGLVSQDGKRYYQFGAKSNASSVANYKMDGLITSTDLTAGANFGKFDTTFNALGYVTFHFNSESLYWQAGIEQFDGKIVVIGNRDADPVIEGGVNETVIARYNHDGTLDTTFGGANGGYVFIFPQDRKKSSILVRALAQDCHGNIYIGGDISEGNGGHYTYPHQIPFGITPGIFNSPDVTRDFLLIKLDKDGKVVSGFGDEQLEHVNPFASTPFTGVRTDFQGFSDAVFALSYDAQSATITAVGQASVGKELEDVRTGAARYSTKDGSLDTSFGTAGKAIFDSNTSGGSFARAVVTLDNKDLLAIGQSTVGKVNTVWGNEDLTQTDTMVVKIS